VIEIRDSIDVVFSVELHHSLPQAVLICSWCETSMSESYFSISGQPVYPHFKITNEDFPRALATRILKQDGDEYFGAFLNRTNVRVLIDFLNRTFRLRSCTIAIDGSFPVPCTQYFSKRCIAPCVASLCDRESYLEMVDLVRHFLRNDRELFLVAISRKIDRTSEDLDFESAAFFRDLLQSVQTFWSNGRYQVWLDDATDTFELLESDDAISVIIVTNRGRRPLGEIVYEFPKTGDVDPAEALHDVIDQFYIYHLPREIRVSHDFDGRTKLAKELGARFARKINITVDSEAARRATAERALVRTKDRLELEAISTRPTIEGVKAELKNMFGLLVAPSLIEAFDAAHISATGFAAAVSVWKDGRDLPNEYEHWTSDRTSELETLAAFVVRRLGSRREKPDVILIDGGQPQLNAVAKALDSISPRPVLIAAVKPKGKHSSISHFLTEDGSRIEYEASSHAAHLLQRLRDEAHDLANAAHRLGRDMMHFYELAAILPSLNERERHELIREVGSIKKLVELEPADLETRFEKRLAARVAKDLAAFRRGDSTRPEPLIVPIRFVELDGAAEDLIPIEARLVPQKARKSISNANDGRI
jgi:excinuclease ABC subunit C